jgi:predicted 2-oxoglutarate/Fe(II)-dependent dioxygenase YbiX
MIHEFPDLLDKKLCDNIIEYFEHSQKSENEDFFSGRTLYVSEIEDIMLRRKLKSFIYKVTQQAYIQYQEFIFPTFCDIVKWYPGMNMEVHVDDGYPDLSMRHYTSICYLNDDYGGGETFLPNHNYSCIPKKGKVVIFPSYYPHGVNLIKNNLRYTLAMWFTRDDEHLME